MLYDQNKADTVRQALQMIGSDLYGKARQLTTSRMYQYLDEDTKRGRLIQKNTVKSLDNRIIEECSIESHQKLPADKCQLILADFRDVASSIETNSKDLIFTDPPYNEADLPLYRDLGLFANRVLRPGGSLVCYAGHYALPQIFDYMRDSGLSYLWPICVKHAGGLDAAETVLGYFGFDRITYSNFKRNNKGAVVDFEEFLDKISPLKTANKLGTILIQLPPSFTVSDFKNIEGFLDRVPSSSSGHRYDYAVEFRHPSWSTEGPWDMLKHYNIAAVMTDSPAKENLQFLSDITITTADHSFIRFHGRNTKNHYWYDYLYSKEELKPWLQKVSQIKQQTKVLRIYFNNHYGGKAVVNALEFKEMNGMLLSETERKVVEEAKHYPLNKFFVKGKELAK